MYCRPKSAYSYRKSLESRWKQSSEQGHDARQLAVRVHQIDSLRRDPESGRGATHAVLDERAPDALPFVAVLEHDERRRHTDLTAVVLEDLHVADLMDGARPRDPGMRARMLE